MNVCLELKEREGDGVEWKGGMEGGRGGEKERDFFA